ncbi:MAG: carbamoyl-phosphate synthase small subunit, partial [Gammaproteobacteria bacterium]|nr:carbamoyl-phosphate synthase small subunit [Gammaproteobacteria bacterium]
MRKPALLALEDGTVFYGESIGIEGETVGEVVFNTAMTGYQEILTDPSYSRQIVTLTYPHIGNVGTNADDAESTAVHAAGLVIRDLPLVASSWRNEVSLEDYLQANKVVAIADIDTRKLTRILREKGAQSGCIVAGAHSDQGIDEAAAIAKAKAFAGLKGMDLAKEVTTADSYQWADSVWDLETGLPEESKDLPRHVVAYDFG